MSENATKPTRSRALATEIRDYLRSRTPLLWVVTREEARAEQYLAEAAAAAGYVPRTWDAAAGLKEIDGRPVDGAGDPGIDSAFAFILAKGQAVANRIKNNPELARDKDFVDRGAWIMRDLPPWVSGPVFATQMRALRNLARALPAMPRQGAQAIIVLTPDRNVPPELAGHATVIEWPLPDRAEIEAILRSALAPYANSDRVEIPTNGTFDAAVDAAIGLTGSEAGSCYAKSLVQSLRIDPAAVSKEKKRVVAREGLLEWLDPIPGGLDAVGGLETLKEWLVKRALAYSPKARAYGLKPPKGALLVGPPGTGKTYTAKAISTAWGVPLLKLDMGALKSKFVGESEGNLRKAFAVIEAIGRCVVLVDEIEKALAGATQGAADGGVSADALGALLTWMNDRSGEAFVLATSNAADVLPPELMRKGRFDDVWFCDLPTENERDQIVRASLRANGRNELSLGFNGSDPDMAIGRVAAATAGFTGSEIAAIVPGAMFAAFADGEREITDDDLLAEVKTVVPLSKTAAEKIEKLREWAKTRARPAGKAATAASVDTRVGLDLDI